MNLSSLFRRTITLPAPTFESARAPQEEGEALTLADVALLKVPLSWHEAVGLVVEFIDRRPPQGALLDPARVTLSPIGELRALSAATLSGAPVKRAAQLLEQLIGEGTAPAALRDLIAQDSSDRPTHASLAEFAQALTYFERPNRRADVAAVFTRAQSFFQKAAVDKELERLRSRAVQERQAKPATVRLFWQWPRTRQVLHGAFVVLLCAIIAVSGVALVWYAIAPVPPRAATLSSTQSEAPARAPVSMDRAMADTPLTSMIPAAAIESTVQTAAVEMKKLIDRGLAAVGVSAVGTKSQPEAVAPAPPAPRARAQKRPSSWSSTATPVPTPAPTGRRPARGEWLVSVQEVTSPSGLAELVSVVAEREDDSLLPIYSRADADVDPAVLVRPQMPSVPEGLVPQDGPSEFDLLIDQSGHVEQVRLVSPNNRFNDRILVSAAKAWQFQPASRDGQPVRYRLRLRIAP